MNDPATMESAALLAYGVEMLSRLQGRTEGPAVLALWRQSAWKPEGSPKKGFRLSADLLVKADAACAQAIREGSSGE
jgi:hypothetical protein